MKKIYVVIFLILAISISINGHCGVTITNGSVDKPNLRDKGAVPKALVDAALDRVDVRLGKQIWVDDPGVAAVLENPAWNKLSEAIKAIGSTSTNLRVSRGTFNVNGNLTIPSGITLLPERGVTLSVATGVTLTINGGFQAGLYPVFSCKGTGKVVFGSGAINKVYPQWWGAKGDGVTDDTAAIAAACGSLGTYGGMVAITEGLKCLIDNNLTIPANVHLVGPHKILGTPGDNGSAPYANLGGVLVVNSAKSVTMASGASLNGLLLYRKGMTFPAPNSSSFAGTAINVGGDDAAVFRCMILGFNKAIYLNGYQRGKFEYVLGDNNNGIEIGDCWDIPYISNCHMWPFTTVSSLGGGGHTVVERSGVAYYIHGAGDCWAKLTNCFSYGYYIGFQITDVEHVTLIGCAADNTWSGTAPQHTGCTGIAVTGTSNDTKIIGCIVASAEGSGIYLGNSANLITTIEDTTFVNCIPNGISVNSGDVIVKNCNFRNLTAGLNINNVDSRVNISGNRFYSMGTAPIYMSVSSNLVFIGPNDYGDFAAGMCVVGGTGALTAQSVASASTPLLPGSGDTFNITGTTSFGGLSGGYAGREVTLIFDDVLIVHHGTGNTNNMKLNGGVSFTTAGNSTLTLRHNGTQWFETGRAN